MRNIPFIISILLFLSIGAFSQDVTKCLSANANLRTDSIIGDNIITVIPKGTCLTVDKTLFEANWIIVEYNGQQGFVNSSLFINIQVEIDKSSASYIDYNNSNSSKSNSDYYINSKGEKVKSPTHSSSVPEGATAICNDGTYSYSQSRRGTCSHHGGVKQWLNN